MLEFFTGNPRRPKVELDLDPGARAALEMIEAFGGGGVQGAVVAGANDLSLLARAAGGAAEVAKHHAWPKYLGGAAKQELVSLPRKLHEAFHSGLDKILPRQWGTKSYEGLSDAAKAQMHGDLAAYTRAFDAKYGTQIYDALVKAGFPGN